MGGERLTAFATEPPQNKRGLKDPISIDLQINGCRGNAYSLLRFLDAKSRCAHIPNLIVLRAGVQNTVRETRK